MTSKWEAASLETRDQFAALAKLDKLRHLREMKQYKVQQLALRQTRKQKESNCSPSSEQAEDVQLPMNAGPSLDIVPTDVPEQKHMADLVSQLDHASQNLLLEFICQQRLG